MSTDRETTRIVRSWLEAGVTRLPDRVLDVVLDQVPATPQRRSWWPPRRDSHMNKLAVTALAGAAVLAIAIAGYNMLPRTGISGSDATPGVTGTVLARGSFTVPDNHAIELDARGSFQAGETRTDVTGTLLLTDDATRISVDLDCARKGDPGILAIGGIVDDSTAAEFPKGSLLGIILQEGAPVRASFIFGPTLDGPCMTFLLSGFGSEGTAGLRPIEGNVELRP